jgi:hypothetical protein
MKKQITFLLILFSFNNYAQSQFEGASARNGIESLLYATTRGSGTLGTFFNNGPSSIEGNAYLFKSWSNTLRIKINEKQYLLYNINLNIKTNNLESKVRDSLFVFDGLNTDYLYINNRKFKRFYFAKNKRKTLFEVIYDCGDFMLLKDYKLEVRKGDIDPLMIKKTRYSYNTVETYYTKDDKGFVRLKLKKKSILGLLKNKKLEMKTFIKKNKLSVKRDEDLKKILKFYCNL